MESSLDLPEGASETPEEVDDDEEEPVDEDLTAAEIVKAAIANGQLDVDSVPIDQRELDSTKEQTIQRFVRDGCKCDLGTNRGPCSAFITARGPLWFSALPDG